MPRCRVPYMLPFLSYLVSWEFKEIRLPCLSFPLWNRHCNVFFVVKFISTTQTTCRMYTWIFAFSNDIMIVMRYNHMWSLEWKAELARLHILWFCLRVCKFQIPLRMFLMRRFVFQSTLSVMCVIMLRQGTHANICT